MARSLLCVSGLVVHYGGRRALDGVDVALDAGTTLAVIGPNGSGKSTLLLAIAGLVAPARGTVDVDRAGVALVLQSTDVDRSLPISVLETVRLARYRRLGMLRRFGPADHGAVARAMARLEVTDLARRQLHELSGGQRQRVLVAQGVAQEAQLLLLDEPVTGLDIRSSELIFDVVAEERAAGRGVIITTHSLDEARRCDEVLLLAQRVIAHGPPEQVIRGDHLATAFGGRFVRLDDGAMFVDAVHHVH